MLLEQEQGNFKSLLEQEQANHEKKNARKKKDLQKGKSKIPSAGKVLERIGCQLVGQWLSNNNSDDSLENKGTGNTYEFPGIHSRSKLVPWLHAWK